MAPWTGASVGSAGYSFVLSPARVPSLEAYMKTIRGCAMLLLWLLPMTGGAMDVPAAESTWPPAPPPAPPSGEWNYLMRLEATTLALLPRAGVAADEGLAQV